MLSQKGRVLSNLEASSSEGRNPAVGPGSYVQSKYVGSGEGGGPMLNLQKLFLPGRHFGLQAINTAEPAEVRGQPKLLVRELAPR
jgi:hypothetical protein